MRYLTFLVILPALIAVCYGLEGATYMESTISNVGIMYLKISPNKGRDIKCQGAAISKDFFLTAASCIDVNGGIKKIEARYTDMPKPFKRDGGILIEGDVASIKIAPGYDKKKNAKDLAIVKLKSSIDKPGFTPFTLPSKATMTPDAYAKELSLGYGMTGWGDYARGFVQVNHQIAFYALPNAECKKAYSELADDAICMDLKFNSLCKDDGGTPVVRYSDGVLAGIASAERLTCKKMDKPSLVTNVGYYIDFIKEVTGVEPPAA